jgi:hypothetical protein
MSILKEYEKKVLQLLALGVLSREQLKLLFGKESSSAMNAQAPGTFSHSGTPAFQRKDLLVASRRWRDMLMGLTVVLLCLLRTVN